MVVVCVCLSVCPMSDLKLTMEGRSKLKIGRKEARDMGDPWPHLKVKGQGHQAA